MSWYERLRNGRFLRTDDDVGAGDRPPFGYLRHDISERILRRPFR